MTERTFRALEHTADKGIEATGRTLAEAFENAAYGMFSLFADLSSYEATCERRVTVTAESLDGLVWTWLSELLYIFEVEGLLPVDFGNSAVRGEVPEAGGQLEFASDVAFRSVGHDIEWLGSPAKAVTYHQLKVEQTGSGWRVQVYVDV
jgi:SHS2 domain-containing protein